MSEQAKPNSTEDSDECDCSCTSCLDRIPALKANNVRQGFVRKVYALVFVQLGISTIFITIGMVSQSYRDFVRYHMWLYITTSCLSFVICLLLICAYKLFKAVPWNYILFFLIAFLMSYSVSVFTCFYSPLSVLICASITLSMVFALTVYACFTKDDFTKWYIGLIWSLIGTLIAAIFFSCFCLEKIIAIWVCFGVLVLVSIFFLANTHLIVCGGKYGLTVDDYILGAILLYTDIIRIFLYLLGLGGSTG